MAFQRASKKYYEIINLIIYYEDSLFMLLLFLYPFENHCKSNNSRVVYKKKQANFKVNPKYVIISINFNEEITNPIKLTDRLDYAKR